MKTLKNVFQHILVDGLSGMATGLFATLIIGTIAEQIGNFIGGTIGSYIVMASMVTKSLMGAGIGIGVAQKYKAPVLVTLSAAAAGMVGAYATKLIAGEAISQSVLSLTPPGEPLGAFIAAFVAIEIGMLISGKTKLDILITPFVSIGVGAYIGVLVGPPISTLMTNIGNLINMGAHNHPLVMGMVVSVIMGIVLTLPISSAALGVILGLNGIAAGAATVGCCAQMVGFAVASYRENGLGGLLAQGLGTSMLQMPNIIKKPIIWIPPILTSAILGPVATCLLGMANNAIGSGMGTSGLVGPIMTYQTMTGDGASGMVALMKITVMHIIAPAVITLGIAEFMRFYKWIKEGDMRLDV